MKVLELLDELKAEINESPKSVFSNKKTVDAEILLEILDDLVAAVPEEIEEAGRLLGEKKKILEDAKKEAESIIKSAEEELAKRVSEDEVTKAAEENAKELMHKANANAKEITLGAKEYADDIMKELELYFGEYLKACAKEQDAAFGKAQDRQDA